VTDPAPLDAGAHTYSVSLPQFEGPLDLLLHLCQKHELDILDIPIGFITKKYLEYLAVLKLVNLDIAAEYLVMAATLAHIKSKMLLPTPPPGQEDEVQEEEEEDPREALIKRLLEYQKYKLASQELEAKGIAAQNVFLRGGAIEQEENPGLPPLAQIPLFRLIEAFQGVLAKSKIKITHDIVADRISITDRIHELTAVLEQKPRCMFEELFEGLTSKFDLVITFLALLEMTRLRMTRLYQTDTHSPLYVEYTAAAGDPLPEGLEPSSWMPKPAAPAEPQAPAAPPPPAAEAPKDAPAEAPEDADPVSPDEDTRDTLLDPLPAAPPAPPSAAAEVGPLVSREEGHVLPDEGAALDEHGVSDAAPSASNEELPDEDLVVHHAGGASANEGGASKEEPLASSAVALASNEEGLPSTDDAVASDEEPLVFSEGAAEILAADQEPLLSTNEAVEIPATREDDEIPATREPDEASLGSTREAEPPPSIREAEDSLPSTNEAEDSLPSTREADDSLPSTNEAEDSLPSTSEAEGSPATRETEEPIPSTREAEESPATRETEQSVPSTDEAEESPTRETEEPIPSTREAEESPATRETEAKESPATREREESVRAIHEDEQVPAIHEDEPIPAIHEDEPIPAIHEEAGPFSEGTPSPEPSGDSHAESVAPFNEDTAPSAAEAILSSAHDDAPLEEILAPSEEDTAPEPSGESRAEIVAPSNEDTAPSGAGETVLPSAHEEPRAPSHDAPTPSNEAEPNVAPAEPLEPEEPGEPAFESPRGDAAPEGEPEDVALDAPADAPMPRFDVVSPLEAELVASLVRDVEGPASETSPAEAPAHDTDASAADEKSST